MHWTIRGSLVLYPDQGKRVSVFYTRVGLLVFAAFGAPEPAPPGCQTTARGGFGPGRSSCAGTLPVCQQARHPGAIHPEPVSFTSLRKNQALRTGRAAGYAWFGRGPLEFCAAILTLFRPKPKEEAQGDTQFQGNVGPLSGAQLA